MTKAAPYTVLVDGLTVQSGDGDVFAPAKGKVSPKNEYEEACLIVAVHNGYAEPPASSHEGDE